MECKGARMQSGFKRAGLSVFRLYARRYERLSQPACLGEARGVHNRQPSACFFALAFFAGSAGKGWRESSGACPRGSSRQAALQAVFGIFAFRLFLLYGLLHTSFLRGGDHDGRGAGVTAILAAYSCASGRRPGRRPESRGRWPGSCSSRGSRTGPAADARASCRQPARARRGGERVRVQHPLARRRSRGFRAAGWKERRRSIQRHRPRSSSACARAVYRPGAV